ncbi:phage terminase small subunit [Paenibacillus sp. FSL H8-0548]|uniref:phage terminase small subunit n=1 Tax=Paenibacillus sp. FSL H8-0548 TaxID=1920422 RepID=UPI00117D798F|nr:phage terminase small subunit [Paenibacillus sp. FSL H8-0548]
MKIGKPLNSLGGGVDEVMAREQSPDQKRAFKLWFDSGKTMKPAAIAEELGISAALVRKWKSYYKWEEIKPKGRGAPKGNKNAIGNKGGGPVGNDKAVKHGLFRKFLPQDEETLQIYDMTADLSPLDILWEGIRIKWTNFIRSQTIQHVKDKKDITKVLVKKKPGMFGTEQEWEYQQPWDKQAVAMTSQSAAFNTIVRSIKQYEDMLRTMPVEDVQEEHKLRIQKLKLEVEKLANNDDDIDDDSKLIDDWVNGVMQNE